VTPLSAVATQAIRPGDAAAAAPAEDGKIAKAWRAAEGFEAMFLRMMFGAMRRTELNSGLFDSNAMRVYRDMQDEQMVEQMAQSRRLGFSKQIFDWMIRARPDLRAAVRAAEQARATYGAAKAAGRAAEMEVFAGR
jgi:flagellar protein FlgJ